MELGEPDESGRRRPIPIKGSEFQLACDMAVVAIGAGPNPLLTTTTAGLDLNKRGYIVADPETGRTSKAGVWAGGDIVTGPPRSFWPWAPGEKRPIPSMIT